MVYKKKFVGKTLRRCSEDFIQMTFSGTSMNKKPFRGFFTNKNLFEGSVMRKSMRSSKHSRLFSLNRRIFEGLYKPRSIVDLYSYDPVRDGFDPYYSIFGNPISDGVGFG